jgi:hypothetical protein
MELTVCMIVRDDARRLDRALRSCRGIVSEAVVVDTGSTDGSDEVAASHGARVVQFDWCDDFAAARNAALPHVRTPWALWLDSDEALHRPSFDVLPALLSDTDRLAFTLLRRDFAEPFSPDGTPVGECMTVRVLRLFRADVGIAFTGRCHEQPVFPPGPAGRALDHSPLILDHESGYHGASRLAKQARNARLLEFEVRDRPDRLFWVAYAGVTLLDDSATADRGHAYLVRALTLFAATLPESAPTPPGLEHLPSPLPTTDPASNVLTLALLDYAACPPAGLSVPLAISPDDAAELARVRFPDVPGALWLRARRHFQAGRYEQAVPLLRRLIDYGVRRVPFPDFPPDPGIVGDDARVCLAACLIRLAELDDAERVLRDVASNSPRHPEARANLALIADLRARFRD